MVADALKPAIRETIRQNEIGDDTPYYLSFAKYGKSGASFGFMQGDTNVSELAANSLRQVLVGGDIDSGTVDKILGAVCRPLPDGNPLSTVDFKTVNDCLSSNAGRRIVDSMDEELLAGVYDGLDTCVAASADRGLTVLPIAFLYIAPWINMSGPPTLLKTWLHGASIHGVPAPNPPNVTKANMQSYLQATAYFQAHPKNFVHFEACVAKGASLLP